MLHIILKIKHRNIVSLYLPVIQWLLYEHPPFPFSSPAWKQHHIGVHFQFLVHCAFQFSVCPKMTPYYLSFENSHLNVLLVIVCEDDIQLLVLTNLKSWTLLILLKTNYIKRYMNTLVSAFILTKLPEHSSSFSVEKSLLLHFKHRSIPLFIQLSQR